MTKVMIVAPHPDDAELAMGASIAGMVAAGWHVFVLDLTDGEPTPHGSREIRAWETGRATAILRIPQRACLELPNRYLEASLENRRRLAEQIRLYAPDVLFGPLMPDDHPDHVAATASKVPVYGIASSAAKPAPRRWGKRSPPRIVAGPAKGAT